MALPFWKHLSETFFKREHFPISNFNLQGLRHLVQNLIPKMKKQIQGWEAIS